jgi:hypothetical protein
MWTQYGQADPNLAARPEHRCRHRIDTMHQIAFDYGSPVVTRIIDLFRKGISRMAFWRGLSE